MSEVRFKIRGWGETGLHGRRFCVLFWQLVTRDADVAWQLTWPGRLELVEGYNLDIIPW